MPIDREEPARTTADIDEGSVTASSGSVYPPLLVTALIVLGLDQLTKTVALESLADGPVDLIEGAVTFRLSYNPGGVFGLGQDWPALFLIATVAVIGFILVWAGRIDDRRWLVPLGLVLGGGLGNVFDRIVRDTEGKVVDFIDLHVWPIFNLADSAIVTGVLLILLLGFRTEK